MSVASATPVLKPYRLWFALLPALYMVFDLAEDLSLIRMLTWREFITKGSVDATQWLTRIKFSALALSAVQITLLAVWWLRARQEKRRPG